MIGFVSKKKYDQLVEDYNDLLVLLRQTEDELHAASATQRANQKLKSLWASRPQFDEADEYDG